MRVIAGDARGRKLKAPRNRAVRPTADRVKEALFSILASAVTEANVLDLFAGTGSLSLEALSRGAAHAVLVDSSARCAEIIRDNLGRLGFAGRATLLAMPAARAARALARRGEQFDIIFVDPPYGEQLVPQTLRIIAQENLLRRSGVVVAEHAVRDPVEPEYGGLLLTDRRRYGDTALSLFKESIGHPQKGKIAHGE